MGWTIGPDGQAWFDGEAHSGRVFRERRRGGVTWKAAARAKLPPVPPPTKTAKAAWDGPHDFKTSEAARAWVEAWFGKTEADTAPDLLKSARVVTLVSRTCDACGGTGERLVCAKCDGKGCDVCQPAGA